MIPLLALTLAAPTLLEGCALITAVFGALKLGLDTLETAQRIQTKRKELEK